MGLQLDYFYSLTPRQFSNAVKGFRKKEENRSKEAWVMHRRTAFWILSPNLKEGARELDLDVFYWEKDSVKELAEAEVLQMQEIIKKSQSVFDRYDEKMRLQQLEN